MYHERKSVYHCFLNVLWKEVIVDTVEDDSGGESRAEEGKLADVDFLL